jgi:hypothetical protein
MQHPAPFSFICASDGDADNDDDDGDDTLAADVEPPGNW